MLQKTFSKLLLLTAIFGLCGCEFLRNHTAQDFFTGTWRQTTPKQTVRSYGSNEALPRHPSSIVVCRSHQCAPAKLSMSREYIFNSLMQLFDNNNYQKILICQADPQSHVCLENYITLPITVGIVPTNAYIDHAKITDVIVGSQNASINIILNYNLTYGGQVAECTPAQTLLFARQINHVILEDSGYNCKMTTIGNTNVKTFFAIDYIDLDYGYIGGYYSVGLSGPSYGGGNGYMLLRLPKNAYPLSPALKAPKQKAPSKFATGSTDIPEDPASSSSSGVQIFPIEKKK